MDIPRMFSRRVTLGSKGFGLLEAVVGMSILGIAGSLIMTSIFQTLSLQRSWRADLISTQQLRRAGTSFSFDAVNAQATDLTDGAAAVNAVTLGWADTSGAAHAATYNLAGTDLLRTFDGVQSTVARNVAATQFSRVGSLLTFDLTIRRMDGRTATRAMQTFLRVLQP